MISKINKPARQITEKDAGFSYKFGRQNGPRTCSMSTSRDVCTKTNTWPYRYIYTNEQAYKKQKNVTLIEINLCTLSELKNISTRMRVTDLVYTCNSFYNSFYTSLILGFHQLLLIYPNLSDRSSNNQP